MSLAKTGFGYQRGLADLGRGSFAWMQPDGSWGDAERIAVNVATLYREFAGDAAPPNPAELFALTGEIWKRRRS